jgi:hypothetical protein
MTNRRIAAAVLAMLLWTGVNEAGAQGFGWRGWLDRLSGPGVFRDGWEFSVPVFCYGVPGKRGLNRPNTDDLNFNEEMKRKWEQQGVTEEPRQLEPAWGHTDVACVDKWDWIKVGDTGQRRGLWRIAVGFELVLSSKSAHNPLVYEGRAPGDGPKVTLSTFVQTVDFVPNAWLEFGAGAGVGRFSTAGFSTAWKPLIQPLRISVRPLTLLTIGRKDWKTDSKDRPGWVGILQLKFNLTSFPGGFDAADFGATPGSWRVGFEALPSFGLVLDFGELVRR